MPGAVLRANQTCCAASEDPGSSANETAGSSFTITIFVYVPAPLI